MSYPIRSGIWFQNEDDFNKVAADLKDLLDYTKKDKLFVHWETYWNGKTVEIFEAIAKKYPEMTCMGYSEYYCMGGASGLSITINRGHIDIQKYESFDDFSEYKDEEDTEYIAVDNKEIYAKPEKVTAPF